MKIVSRRKIYFAISILMLLGSLYGLVFYQLKLGIDFTGGTLMEVNFLEERPANIQIKERLADLQLGEVNLQPAGGSGLILKTKDIDEATHQEILSKLGNVEEIRFESVGPVIGAELKRSAIWAIALSLLAIVIYIAWSFRKVSKPVPSWQYGLVAIISLFHDVFITLGVFSFLGHFKGVEIGLPLVAAFLTILGYSVNNSIVIFDRARENLLRSDWKDFAETINLSINQSIRRCINTALTTLLVLLAIFFLGGESIKYFALALIIGITVGTYSSIFITAPLIVSWQNRRKNG